MCQMSPDLLDVGSSEYQCSCKGSQPSAVVTSVLNLECDIRHDVDNSVIQAASRQHLSSDDCPEDNSDDYQNCCVVYCICSYAQLHCLK